MVKPTVNCEEYSMLDDIHQCKLRSSVLYKIIITIVARRRMAQRAHEGTGTPWCCCGNAKPRCDLQVEKQSCDGVLTDIRQQVSVETPKALLLCTD